MVHRMHGGGALCRAEAGDDSKAEVVERGQGISATLPAEHGRLRTPSTQRRTGDERTS